MNSLLPEKYWDDIKRCLNIPELAPTLIERGLLLIGDPVENTPDFRAEFVSKVRQGGKKTFGQFSSCFDADHYEHMGHAYIACLLHNRPYADERTIRLSSQYKEIFSRNMTRVVELLNVNCLKPQMVEKGLITSDEVKCFHNNDKRETLKLFNIIESKGPTAFFLLVECIGHDKEHKGHKELHSLILEKQIVLSPSPKRAKPAELTTEGPLSDQEYHDRRHKFEGYYHSGQWGNVQSLAEECMESSVLEVQSIGHLELALSYIFRLKEEEVLHNVSNAEAICKTIENSNRTFLSGRCKYLLALLYHYLENPVKANQYINEAKGILFHVEVAEDKSFAMYCDAIISAATLTDKSSQYEFTEVTHKFEIALNYSLHTYDMDILVIYSFLRLSRLYLGTTVTKVGSHADEQRIQQTKDCQEKLKNSYYDEMDERCKGLYYLNECDLCMATGETDLAVKSAKQAEGLAQLSGCPLDIQAVQVRLKALALA